MPCLRTSLVLVFAAVCLATGCSDDPASPTADGPTVIRVDLPRDATAFGGVIDQARHPRQPALGPFVLQGYNKHYDYDTSALLLSLAVTNTGDQSQAGPVSLTFLSVTPHGVILLDPPGGQPTYEFAFSDADGIWSPGESSLPLTVAFGVAPDLGIAFRAELATGFGPASGVVSGVVWRDSDSDGVRTVDEPGAEGLAVDLYQGSGDSPPLPAIRRVHSGPDGKFAFGGLAAGDYNVRVETRPYLAATTATTIDVVLEADERAVAPVDTLAFGFTAIAVDSLTITATADAMIRADVSGRMNDNHGADPYLGIGTTRSGGEPNDAIRGLVRFDLSLLAQPVVAAYLEMTIARFRDGFNQTYQLDVNPIVESGDRTPWIEGNGTEVGPAPPGVVWVDAADGVAWIGAGDGGDANNQTQPDFSPSPVASAVVVQSERVSGDVVSWDVTDLVNAWIAGTTPNYGIVVRDVNPLGTFRQLWFWSRDGLEREYAIVGVQPGPRLVLLY